MQEQTIAGQKTGEGYQQHNRENQSLQTTPCSASSKDPVQPSVPAQGSWRSCPNTADRSNAQRMDKGHSVSQKMNYLLNTGHVLQINHMTAPQVNSISTVGLDIVKETPFLQVNSPLVNQPKQASQSYVFCILVIQSSYSSLLSVIQLTFLHFYKSTVLFYPFHLAIYSPVYSNSLPDLKPISCNPP